MTALGERELSKLRWRCRRGLLENDLFVERFFARHGAAISEQLLSHADPRFAGYRWLRSMAPVARVGKSIKLYHVKPAAKPPAR